MLLKIQTKMRKSKLLKITIPPKITTIKIAGVFGFLAGFFP